MIEALKPLGVPQVSNSMPLFVFKPVGRSFAMLGVFWSRGDEVWSGACRRGFGRRGRSLYVLRSCTETSGRSSDI